MSASPDISNRKRSGEELQRQASMLDVSDDAIFVWDLDGNIVYWNRGAEHLYGFTRDEAVGRRSHDLLQTDHADSARFVAELRKNRSWVGELRHTSKEGRELVVESRQQVLEESGTRLVVLEINRDVTDRKRSEEDLRLSEERYRALAHATSQIVWITDASGLGRGSQQQWENFTGSDSRDWSWLSAVHPDDRERTEQAWRHSIATGEPYEVEHRLLRRDGQYRAMQARGIPVRDADGHIREWIGTHTDITERKEAEAALARSEEKLRMSLEAAQMGTWDWDLVTGQLVWGVRCKALFGLDPETPMTYETFLSAIDPDDRPRVDAAVQHALAQGSDYDVEMRVALASGRERWLRSKGSVLRDAQGKPLRMSGCMLDITDRKKDEQALQESEERFRRTFENAAVGITHVGLDGRWLRVNQKICEITGYTREELLRTDFQSITHPDDLMADLAQAERLIAGEIDHYAMEKRYIRRDGSPVWIDLSVSLMRHPDGAPHHFISIVADITSRKRVEQDLLVAHQELESKVRERTEELAAANTGLRVLTGRLLRLQDDERRRLSRELHDSAGQKLAVLSMECAALAPHLTAPTASQALADAQGLIAEISAEIRTMSYLLHPPLLDEVGLESALHWYVDGFSKRSGIQTSLLVGEDFGRLSNEHEITIFRVVQECLTNVLRHSGSASAEVRLLRREDRIELEILDQGVGVPKAKLAALNTSGSLGVGLGGMRERLRQLGGELEVVSSGTGTRVLARLPATDQNPADALGLASD